jgi:hypothetical protein
MKTRQEIEEFVRESYLKLRDSDYFEVLRLGYDATKADIYRALNYRTEEFRLAEEEGLLDQEDRARLEEVRQLIRRAGQVLLDDERRLEYLKKVQEERLSGEKYLGDPDSSLSLFYRDIMARVQTRQQGRQQASSEAGKTETAPKSPNDKKSPTAKPGPSVGSKTMFGILSEVVDEEEEVYRESNESLREAEEALRREGRIIPQDNPEEYVQRLFEASSTITLLLEDILKEKSAGAPPSEEPHPAAEAAPPRQTRDGSDVFEATATVSLMLKDLLARPSAKPPQGAAEPSEEPTQRDKPVPGAVSLGLADRMGRQRPPSVSHKREAVERGRAEAPRKAQEEPSAPPPKPPPTTHQEKVEQLFDASEELADLLEDVMPEPEYRKVRGNLNRFKEVRDRRQETPPVARPSEGPRLGSKVVDEELDALEELYDASQSMAVLLRDVLKGSGMDDARPSEIVRQVRQAPPKRESIDDLGQISEEYEASHSMALLLKDVLAAEEARPTFEPSETDDLPSEHIRSGPRRGHQEHRSSRRKPQAKKPERTFLEEFLEQLNEQLDHLRENRTFYLVILVVVLSALLYYFIYTNWIVRM